MISKSSFSFQFELEVTVAPKGATLEVDGKTVTLTDEGKYVAKFEFDKDVSLKSELEGHTSYAESYKNKASKNQVPITLPKAQVIK